MAQPGTTFELKGTITEALKGGKFRVKLDDNNVEIICTISGRLVKNSIHLIVGDKVDTEISVADVTKGRIIWRYK